MKNRPLLMIPGPIEFDPEVILAMGRQVTSHVAPGFIELFGSALEKMREVWLAPNGQPFIMAGSGTLAMDMAASNLVEEGDTVLVVSSGYFGERYAELLKRYGADVTLLASPPGEVPEAGKIEHELQRKKYKVLTFTHVDTSTAVKVDPEPMGQLGQKYGTLTILDGLILSLISLLLHHRIILLIRRLLIIPKSKMKLLLHRHLRLRTLRLPIVR